MATQWDCLDREVAAQSAAIMAAVTPPWRDSSFASACNAARSRMTQAICLPLAAYVAWRCAAVLGFLSMNYFAAWWLRTLAARFSAISRDGHRPTFLPSMRTMNVPSPSSVTVTSPASQFSTSAILFSTPGQSRPCANTTASLVTLQRPLVGCQLPKGCRYK